MAKGSPLNGASWQRKFARAEHHLEQLANLVTAFLATGPYMAFEEVNDRDQSPEPNSFASVSHTWRGAIRRKPPADWSPLVGDCLNNLRCSLDHVAWALAGSTGRNTAFPIFTDPGKYKRVTPGHHLKYIPNDAQAFIESLQPYHHLSGPKAHSLFLLDRLANDDKHRELLGTEVGVSHVSVDSPVGQAAAGDRLMFEFPPQDQLFQDGAILVRYHTSNPNVYVPLQFTFDVALDPEEPAGGQPLLACLARSMISVWLILCEMETRFFSGRLARLIDPPLEGRAEFRVV
jgi:hypothetical protein